jgi:hypothetical protein
MQLQSSRREEGEERSGEESEEAESRSADRIR